MSGQGVKRYKRRGFGAFLVRKLLDFVVTLMLISLLVFFIFYIIPGDPVSMILGTEASPERRAAVEEVLGTAKPPLERYWASLSGLLSKEEPSLSLRFQQPVRSLIAPRLQLSLHLAGLAFFFTLILALPLAILAAKYEGSAFDRSICYTAQVFMAVPGFFMAIILILLFAFVFKTFVPGSYQAPEEGLWRHFKSLILPALALALPKLAQIILFFRTALVQNKRQLYMRTARAKGASPLRLIFCHQLRNSLLPLIMSLSLVLVDLLTGSLIVEQVFVLPGAGRLLFTAIEARDLPLAQGLILILATLVVLINLLADILAAALDPRLQSAFNWREVGEDV